MFPIEKSLQDRFWKYINKTDSCWMWTGTKTIHGYGYLIYWPTRVHHTVHRISWRIHRGEIPIGKFILHKCDIKLCANPDHLWLGTQAENMRDKVSKGRQARGETAALAKLTDNMVREIRKSYIPKVVTQRFLAKKYGVRQSKIWDVLNFRTWKHVQ